MVARQLVHPRLKAGDRGFRDLTYQLVGELFDKFIRGWEIPRPLVDPREPKAQT